MSPAVTPTRCGRDWPSASPKAAFFVIGCAKKVLLADPMARFADPIFSAAATSTPSLVDAWRATLACLSAVARLLRL
jgi:hypothetical protein